MFVAWITLFILSACIVYTWATRAFPRLAAEKRRVVAALAIQATLPLPIGWLSARWHPSPASWSFMALSLINVTMMLSAPSLGLVLAGSSAIARLRRKGSADHDPADGQHAAAERAVPNRAVHEGSTQDHAARDHVESGLTRRRMVEGVAGLAVLGATGSTIGWGIVRGRHAFQLFEVPVRVVGLPRTLDGYVIAQVSDIHAGDYVGERELDEGLELVKKARPDLLVVTGDLVDFDPTAAALVARKLADVAPRDGVCAALGNHDYYAGAARVVGALRAVGIDTLVDDGRVIRSRDRGGIALLGVDDKNSGRYGRSGPRLDRALATVPEGLPRILLSHQPPTVDRWPGRVALQLSGHTHGGQINPGSFMTNMLFEYIAGVYSVGTTTLYVNRGFGTVGPPSRVGVPPEITRIVLVSA